MTPILNRAASALAVFVAAGTLALATPVAAQEIAPEHIALARQYVDLTDTSAVYEIALVEVGIATTRQIVQQNPEVVEETDAAIRSVLEDYADRKGELMDQFARLYAARFTMAELEQIVAFYETPVGLKLAEVNAEITPDLQSVMQVFSNNLQREFFASVRAELRAEGVEL